MELAKTYNPKDIESKWYEYWLKEKFFSSRPHPQKKKTEHFSIVIPPPNVTGVLHMGHMLNNTIQDILTRRARMQGKETCWVPGTDHASIATEARVVKMLKEQGKITDKQDLTREEFLKYAWEWKEKYGGIILEQLKKLGASCDWERTRFTMEPKLTDAVIRVFVDLYKKGYIYRGVRMINWDPQGKTALSDEEVNYKEVNSKLYYIKYQIVGTHNEFVTVATTRPETILGDTAVCVNPDDERYQKLIGKKVIVPIVNREVPLIADTYVDATYGTGCLKITPAHDLNDYELGLKYNLPVIDVIADNGTINEKAGFYIGLDRFEARKRIITDLKEAGLVEKIQDIINKVGFSERTDAVIEPKLSTQWFLKMEEISKPALENVMNDNIKFHPPKFKNMYKHWMENVRDWCISRQLWWGQRIPAFYLPNGEFVVAETAEEALILAKNKQANIRPEDLRQDEDVLDTWFSSWLWPISVFDGFEQYNPKTGKIDHLSNPDLSHYYPTADLVTAPEILFFWVARMIIAGYEYMDELPFKNVYLTGIVRDKLGRKMSKSLGNSPDPLDLIDQYGADGVRVGMLFSSPAGNDLLFDEKLCEQGRNFSNKIWNALRLIKGWQVADLPQPEANKESIAWLDAKINAALVELENAFAQYRISDALMTVYKLVWDDFCSWYLEMIKPEYQHPIDAATYEATLQLFEKLLQILHPFMPFITEEVWHQLRERTVENCLTISPYPTAVATDELILQQADFAFSVITNARNTKNSKQVAPKVKVRTLVKSSNTAVYERFGKIIEKLANIEISFTDKINGAVSFVCKQDEFQLVLDNQIDKDKEREKLLKELEYHQGFKESVDKKLANEKFVSNAAASVIEKEKQKLADAESKIAAIEAALAML